MLTANSVCAMIFAAELFAGVTMLAGYQAWIQPGAPRFRREAAPTPVAVVAPAPAPAAPTNFPASAPPPAEPEPRVTIEVRSATPAAGSRRWPLPPPTLPARVQLPAALPAVPVASPLPRQLPPAPAPVTPAAPAPDALAQGIAALNTGNHAAALAAFRQARKLQPANPDLGYLLGLALEGTGEFGAAIDAFRSCQAGPYASVARSHVRRLIERLRQP